MLVLFHFEGSDHFTEPHGESADESERKLMLFFLESNMDRLRVWLNPLSTEKGFARRAHSSDVGAFHFALVLANTLF